MAQRISVRRGRRALNGNRKNEIKKCVCFVHYQLGDSF